MSLSLRRWLWLALISGSLLLSILQYRLWWDDSGIFASQALKQNIEQLRQQNIMQQQQNDELLAMVRDLKTGSDLLEEYAREDLNLVREGETFVLFAEPEQR